MKEQRDKGAQKVPSESNPGPLSISWHLFGLINTRSLCLSAFPRYDVQLNLPFPRGRVIAPLSGRGHTGTRLATCHVG